MRSIKSLGKGLAILEVIASYPEGARINDISNTVEGGISNLTLYLSSLVISGFVMKDPTSGKYYATKKIAQIAKMAEKSNASLLRQLSKPEMLLLRDKFDENILLCVMEGYEIHFIERMQSRRSIQVLSGADTHYPPHVTAGGKAILAYLSEKALTMYIDNALYHRFTDKSLVNPSALREDILATRKRGYAVNYGEYEKEIMAVAAPILVDSGVVGSIVVQFPTFRYVERDLSMFGKQIMETANQISENFSQSFDPPKVVNLVSG
jgi:DNA-binding IclR family transcriptional regulator